MVTGDYVLSSVKYSSQDKPTALTSYEHLGVWLCSITSSLLGC